jgi:hypothetical protein
MQQSFWTRREFERRVRAYHDNCAKRDRGLTNCVSALASTVLIAFGPFILVGRTPPPMLLIGGLAVTTAAIVALGLFVFATSHRFHSMHGVRCPHCGTLLHWLVAPLGRGSRSRGETDDVSCGRCRRAVVTHS